jgi:peptidoglycan/LPS O-acetylase OafA/YrhL
VKLIYRDDIDGLRALAVLSVILFHFNKDWLPGGFLGVDIFFVISGFLITSIILNEVQSQNFSFQQFYLRRIKRIIPASLFFISLTLLASYLLFLPGDLDRATKSAMGSLVFAANLYFARNVDYFASSSDENPFLHTWSLSVEEQFYLFWPLLLLFICRSTFSLKSKYLLLLILVAISTVIATYWAAQPSLQKWAFYMLPARFGELLIGAIGALILQQKTPSLPYVKTYTSAGILMIVLSLALIHESSLFPGFLALPVCIGTLLMILGGTQPTTGPTVMGYLLSSRAAVYVGKISFSLYLAHWPVLAFYRYANQEYRLKLSAILICVIIIWALAHFSWRYVETPFRRYQPNFKQAFVWIFALPSAALFALGTVIILNQGLPSRFDLDSRSFSVASKALCHTHLNGHCNIGAASNLKPYLLVGDSHAGHFLSYFDQLGKLQQFSMQGQSVDDCGAVFSEQILNPSMARRADCQKLKNFLQDTSSDFSHIIIAERWDSRVLTSNSYLSQLQKYLEKSSEGKQQIILMAQVPKYACDVNRSAMLRLRHSMLGTKKCDLALDTSYQIANDRVFELTKAYASVHFVNLNPGLCNQGCSPYLDGEIAYKDDDHLNIIGAQKLAEKTASIDLEWLK